MPASENASPGLALVAHCRAGFEPEAAADLRCLVGATRRSAFDAPVGRGYVVARPEDFDDRNWRRALERSPPIFVRSLFVGTGPHALFDPATTRGRPDRVAALAALIGQLRAELRWPGAGDAGAPIARASLRLETPDTNEGKELSGLARALAARLEARLVELGVIAARSDGLRTAPAAHLHVLFADGARAYVGASFAPWASPWPMGIPRLAMPRGAPSRSALKLAEAFVVFLGDREREMLRPGMRAVDLGAAPGGWTWQLAHRGLRVTAVDNGPLKGEVRDDPLVTHLRADGLRYLPKRRVDWMVCDIVDSPARIAALVARWIGEGHARRAIFNLKLPMRKRYDEVRRCETIIGDALAKARVGHTLRLRQLYHDREEVTGFVAGASD